MLDPKVQTAIDQNARIVQDFLRDQNAPSDFAEPALRWLEGYLDRRRDQLNYDERNRLINMIGAFLGECLRLDNSGIWIEDDGRYGVQVGAGGLIAFPFSKVAKYIDDGAEAGESFASMFRSTPALVKYTREQQKGEGDV